MPKAQSPVALASQAQVGQIDRRVGALESQMRAVQRQVFPGGDKRFFAPEVMPEAPVAAAAPGTPATAPLVDLSQRVTALETGQRQLTGQIEELGFRLKQIEAAIAKFEREAGGRLDALEGKTAPAASNTPPAAATATVPQPQVASAPAAPVPRPAPAASETGPGAAAALSGAAAADPLVAQYEAGYALYEKGDHAAAEKALRAFAQANPGHPRASNASYWAGRALMQQNLPGDAARVFYGGYQANPKGQRAH
ncbi:MAG: tetratricopeptide repeat protein, partial [Sandaracinobacteroides sp.]